MYNGNDVFIGPDNNVKESSSVESAVLDRWVSHSLQNCQKSLTDEIFNELAHKAGTLGKVIFS